MLSRKLMAGGIGLIISIGGGYYYYTTTQSEDIAPVSRVITVSTGSLSSSIKATGNISAIEESTLSFGREGIVAAIYKKEGEVVQAGELIAEISAGTANLDMESARRNLSDAQATYNELFDAADPADLAKAKATLEESEATLKLMEAQYEADLIAQKNSLAEAEESLSLLKEKVALAQSQYEYTEKNLSDDNTTTNLERDIESAWTLSEETSRIFSNLIDDIEEVTGMDYKASDLYGDLGSQDFALKARTDSYYSGMLQKVSLYQTGMINIRNTGKNTEFDSVYSSLQDTKQIITDMTELTSLVLQELSATPVSGSAWSDDKISTARTGIEAIASTLGTKLNSINSTLITLKNYGSDDLQDLADKNTLTSQKQSLQSAQNTLAKAERDIESLKKDQELKRVSSQNNIAKQKNTITQNQYSYIDLTDGPSASERRSAESKVASANISLERAAEGMKDYQISASFDGTIEDIPWEVGETAETQQGILIANKNAYKIALSLDQIDIVKVKEGMRAVVTLDAYANKEFSGSVLSISATPTITSGVVSYTATVSVMIDDVDVMSNMSASVSIIVSDNDNAILIPAGAITSKDGKSYVTITTGNRESGGKTEEREVTIGTTNNGNIEILTGLSVGENILFSSAPRARTGSGGTTGTTTRNNSNQLLRGAGGGGPPGGF